MAYNLFINGPYQFKNYNKFKTIIETIVPESLICASTFMLYSNSIAHIDHCCERFVAEHNAKSAYYNGFDELKHSVDVAVLFHHPGCIETQWVIDELTVLKCKIKILVYEDSFGFNPTNN